MNRNQSLRISESTKTEMNTTHRQTRRDVGDSLAKVRALIEREFGWLRRQQPRVFQLALNEAEALAWQSGYPHLFFPVLAWEKAATVAEWYLRQQTIRQREPAVSFAA